MRYRFFLFLLSALLLAACGSNQLPSDKIPFLNQVSYALDGSERVAPPDQAAVDHYESSIESSGLNIPLYRCAYTDDLIYYFGIPFDLTTDSIASAFEMGEITEVSEEEVSYRYASTSSLDNRSMALVFEQNDTKAFIYCLLNPKSKATLPSSTELVKRFTP